MTSIELKNGHIMVKELVRTEEEKSTTGGLFIPEETLEDEQVSQGTVVQKTEDYNNGDVLLFHKVMPVDASMKLDGDERLEKYFFIKSSDVICKIEK